VLCPHCEEDTPATLPYCQHCGLSVDLTIDKVTSSFVEEAESRAVAETEARCRSWLFAAAVALVVAIAIRILLAPAAPGDPVLPAYVVSEKGGAIGVEPLPLEVPAIEVPTK
jgi:hypothetical protein